MTVKEKLIASTQHSLLCVGLDSNFDKLPERFKQEQYPQFRFNIWIIEQTHTFVGAYKANLAFYEARGAAGWRELAMTMEYLQENYPDIFIIADAKRADIGSTNEGYVTAIFDELGFDAVTLHPYLGKEALQPFLKRKDKMSIILCRTSNLGAGELQDLKVNEKPLWQVVAEKVVEDWNTNNNCMLVVGATYPEEMRVVREIVGDDIWFLVPGIGAQGGDVEAVMKAGVTQAGGIVINSSRGIIFSESPGATAKSLHEQIKKIRINTT